MLRIHVLLNDEELEKLENKRSEYMRKVGVSLSRQKFARIYLMRALKEGWLP